MSTIKSQILEAIFTHPEETFIVTDILKQLPENVNIHSVRGYISKDLKNEGYIKKTDKKIGRNIVYKILKRDMEPVEDKKESPKSDEVTLDQIGKAIVYRIKQLEEKIRDLGQGYSDLQSELNKEKSAAKLAIRERDKTNTELLDENKKLRETIRKIKEIRSETFNLSELVSGQL